jgi:hypothetical protein
MQLNWNDLHPIYCENIEKRLISEISKITKIQLLKLIKIFINMKMNYKNLSLYLCNNILNQINRLFSTFNFEEIIEILNNLLKFQIKFENLNQFHQNSLENELIRVIPELSEEKQKEIIEILDKFISNWSNLSENLKEIIVKPFYKISDKMNYKEIFDNLIKLQKKGIKYNQLNEKYRENLKNYLNLLNFDEISYFFDIFEEFEVNFSDYPFLLKEIYFNKIIKNLLFIKNKYDFNRIINKLDKKNIKFYNFSIFLQNIFINKLNFIIKNIEKNKKNFLLNSLDKIEINWTNLPKNFREIYIKNSLKNDLKIDKKLGLSTSLLQTHIHWDNLNNQNRENIENDFPYIF